MKIEYSEWGLANNYGDSIELNKGLKNYPKLERQILRHEFGHTDKEFTFKDLNHDLTETKVNMFDLVLFIFKNPKSLSQLLPFYWHKKYGFVYDINLIIVYITLSLIISLGVYLAFTI